MSELNVRRSSPRLAVLAAALAVAFAAPAHAQSDPSKMAELERKLEQALQQVLTLSQRVQQLEGAPKAAAPAPAPAAATSDLARRVQSLEQELTAVANRPEEDRGLALHGFADVGYSGGSKSRPVGGYLGSVDFYLTPKFGDRVKSLIELAFEADADGGIATDLERLQVGYTVSDALTLWAGRFHTPYGYWNTAFHHGAQLQNSIWRPVFLEFEDKGGILPAHSVGLWATGGLKLDGGRLNYDLYAGNSPTIDVAQPGVGGTGTLNPNLVGARNRKASLGANVSWSFRGSLEGLTLGAHALTANVADTQATPNSTKMRMLGVWGAYAENDWDIMGEYYGFRNKSASGATGSHSSSASYLQVGRTFNAFTPFVRVERTSLDQNDAYFSEQESGVSYKRVAFGLRYDVNPTAAVKIEGARTRHTDRDQESFSEIRTQFAIRF